MPAAIPLAIVGGSIIGGVLANKGASNAADAQTAAAGQANATQLQMYNQTRADQAPWRQAGGQALGALSQFYGLGGLGQQSAQMGMSPGTSYPNNGVAYRPGIGGGINRVLGEPSPNAGAAAGQGAPTTQQPYDFQSILSNLPGYQFQLQQGQQAAERNLASRGLLNSGAAAKALTQYGQGLAQDYTQQYVGGLQSLAGLGQSANQSTGALGANAANQIGSNLGYAGNASAAGAAGQANAWQSGLAGLGQAAGMYYSPSAVYGRQTSGLSEFGNAQYNSGGWYTGLS